MQYLIDFKNTATDAEITQYLNDNGCSVLKEWDNFDKVFLVETNNAPPSAAIIERLVEENSLAIKPHLENITVDPNFHCHNHPDYPKITVDVNDEKDWWKNFSYIQPQFEEENLILSRLGKGVDVYVMDSGINAAHPEFVDTEIINLYTVTPNDFSDNNGHGTALASLISGKTCGITDATIKVVKIFDPNHGTLQSEFLSALDAIISDHEDNTYGIVNCSWSIPKNEWVEDKLKICADEGLFIICASGNGGVEIENVTPASMWEVMTVGAYNKNLEPCDFSDYTGHITTTPGLTNHGELDGWAPGEDIWCATRSGGYGFAQGTSVACAITSAIVASNLTWRMKSDGSRNMINETLIVSTLAEATSHYHYVAFARDGLLDLSDPRYSTSINRIATIWDNCKSLIKNNPSNEINTVFRVGKESMVSIFSQYYSKEIRWLDELPANFTVSGQGKAWMRPSVEQGPAPGEHYKHYPLRFIRVDTTDVEEECLLNIYVIEPEKDLAEIPPDDPIIPITLLILCSGLGCLFSLGTSDCNDTCVDPRVCCAEFKDPVLQCRCIPGAGGG